MTNDYARLADALRRLPHLSTSERIVLMAYQHFEAIGEPDCGRFALAALTGLHPVKSLAVRRCLEVGGFVNCKRTPRGPYVVTVNWERIEEAVADTERLAEAEKRLAAETALATAARAA